MNLRSSYYVALALLLGMPAYATPPAQPVSSSESLAMASSDSTAVAGALAASSSQATGGDASSGSVSISGGGSGGTSSASGVGVAGSIENRQNASSVTSIGDLSSIATSGDSSAVSGDSSATGGDSSASNGDMSTTVNVEGDTYRQVRQAPSVAQGSIVIQTCSAGGNAGGSNTSGSAFLGFGYITGSCYDLSYAAAYAALGQKQAACDILRTSKRGSIYKKRGVKLPEACSEPTPAVEYATKESVDRMFKRTLQK